VHSSSIPHIGRWHLRVQFLRVGINEPLLCHFDEFVLVFDEVSLALQRAVVDLLDELEGKGDVGSFGGVICTGNCTCSRKFRPCHEGTELVFVGQGSVLVGLSVGATKEGGHDEFVLNSGRVVGNDQNLKITIEAEWACVLFKYGPRWLIRYLLKDPQ
jgi:hypothetical protein